MDTQELRIGNLILSKSDNKIVEVDSIGEWGIDVTTGYGCSLEWDSLKGYGGIPITEEWLTKFGFKQILESSQAVLYLDNIGFEKNGSAWNCILRQNEIENNQRITRFHRISNPILFIHQLQNLYFALTGEELIQK